jgi:hypothetical protein
MGEAVLLDRTRRLLEDPLLGEQDLDAKVRQLLEGEYLRRLGAYRHADGVLARKYEMTFQEFTDQRVPQQRGYTWEVESDAMDWETAVDGIETLRRRLRDLQESARVQRG